VNEAALVTGGGGLCINCNLIAIVISGKTMLHAVMVEPSLSAPAAVCEQPCEEPVF
jgi:hypothetical protein